MAIEAPRCGYAGCGNRDWSGFCYHHRGSAGAAPAADLPPVQQQSPLQLWAEAGSVLPDLGDVLHPHSIREQAVATVRSTVSTEVFRRFPHYDVADPALRDSLIQEGCLQMARDATPAIAEFDADVAAELAFSSADNYGRGMWEGTMVASYALRAEWQLGRQLGVETDVNGVSYAAPLEDFVAAASRPIQDAAINQYLLECSRWRSIIASTSGRAPLNGNPITIGGEPVPEIHDDVVIVDPLDEERAAYAMQQEADEAARVARAEQRAENARAVGRFAARTTAALLGKAVDVALDTSGKRRERQEAAARQQRNREWDVIRGAQLRRAEQSNRAHARAKYGWGTGR